MTTLGFQLALPVMPQMTIWLGAGERKKKLTVLIVQALVGR